MATTVGTYEAGTTIRVRATFRDWVDPNDIDAVNPGAVVDPDDVNVQTFDSTFTLLSSFDYGTDPEVVKVIVAPASDPDREIPYYYYDWTLPEPGTYFIVFTGQIAGDPILVRAKFKTKWDVNN